MSWVHHNKPPPPSSTSTSSSSSVQQTFNINASSMPPPTPINPSVGQKQVPPTTTSASSSLRLQSSSTSSSATGNSSLLMTSQQYTNKTNLSTNRSTAAMRLNSTAPYSTLTQQQRQLQLQQQQQQHQQHVHATSQPLGHNNNHHNPSSLAQGVYNNQQNSWQNHTAAANQNYLSSSKMMPQTQPPMPAPVVTNTAANNNWQSNSQQNYPNATNMMYQPNAVPTTQQQPQATQQQQQHQQQQWPQQNPVQTGTPATYDNLFNHQQQQVSNNMYQQPQQQMPPAHAANYFQQPAAAPPQQQQQPLTSQSNAVNFFDNTNNNNQSTSDGWGDWDWNDNSTIEAQAANEMPAQQIPPPQLQQQQPQQTQPPPPVANDHSQSFSSNIIADSFKQQNNDSWNWNASKENEQHVAPTPTTSENNNNAGPPSHVEQHNDNWNWISNETESQQQQQQTVATNDHQNAASNDNWNWQTNDNQQQIIAATAATELQNVSQPPKSTGHPSVVPPVAAAATPAAIQVASSTPLAPPPPMEFSSNSVTENHNYNTNSAPPQQLQPPPPPTAASTNIPNTVFVSQAKPVTLPSRQYASPPTGNTPVTENAPESALMPPQGFQNVEEVIGSRPPNVQSPNLPPPPPPTAAAPIPAGNAVPAVGVLPSTTGNPFKRSGLAQHHRATGLMSTVPAAPNVFNMPPPPPADFANPSSTAAAAAITLMEPENNELPSQENQEILTPSAALMPTQPSVASISLPNAKATGAGAAAAPLMQTQPSVGSISLPNATTAPLMQTQPSVVSIAPSAAAAVPSHLPPPNDERNQYLQTSHLSENAEEQQPEADGLLPPPGLSRLVLGEPELEASQRMVMGTEAPHVVGGNTATVADVMHLEERHADGEDTASENAGSVISSSVVQGAPVPSAPLSSDRNLYLVPGESIATNQQQRVVTGVELQEQREIEMDGENLEDQQQQQQQQLHQQQQHQQHQNQHQHQQQHQALSPEARNEPPVEGADDSIETALPTPSNSQPLETAGNHHPVSSKSKETHPVSSPNDDDDSDERLLNDRAINHSTAGSSKSRSKNENERQTSSRRRDKRSMNRYDSDEYLNTEDGDYSSDREERQRRERNDRRRNYREGSVRSDRGGDAAAAEEDEKRSRRQQRDKRDKYYYEGEERSRGERSKAESRRSQRQRGYENDSRYETEESTRFDARKESTRRSMRHPEAERTRRGERSDQGGDYDDYQRRGQGYRPSKRSGGDNYESDRRDRRRGGGGEEYDNTLERRRRSDKHRDPRYRDDPRFDPREYEEYRKHSSRNNRDSDLEKEAAGGGPPRSGRMHHDPRHAAAMYGGYPSGGYYDPYTAYYYQQMARTNPQAYAEWYKKYYGQHAAATAGGGMPQTMPGMPGMAASGEASLNAAANDGRESVHSGRSSAHNDIKDRYTHAYITQANEYHRHYHQHQQQQHHQQHHHHQQQLQQHHLQQQMAFNQTHNSTMLEEDSLNQSTSLYSGIGGLSTAHSQTNLSQIHGGYYVSSTAGAAAGVHTSAAAAAAAAMYYARSDYAESRSGAISVRDPDPIATEPQRLTPCKFINEHTVVSFGSGVLVTVKPKYTPHGNISNIVKLLKFKPNDETRKLFKVFPGPLVRGLTHKKTVIEFCQEQIRLGPMETTIYAKQLITNNAEKYRGSYTLMWNLLILLLKQNGMVVGTDIAELLLKNQQQFAYQTPHSSLNNSMKSKSGSASPVEEIEPTKDVEVDTNENNETVANNEKYEKTANEGEATEEKTFTSPSSALTDVEITEKFRNYLLYGNVNEALEWATDNNLWGHALFLASKLDRRSHANVMMKFANKLALNDPLQTLYQLMSGRTPSSVTCVQDEKWGDWRPHLSMILSNTSQKPELDRKAITTLGDSLFNRGDLYAAHFCYLMAQVSFGRYQDTATQETTLQQHLPKLVLLGSSHYKQFQEFAHNEAIIMTEIYEYACSLNDEKFSIVEFQPYKFVLATRLLDYGFHLKSLMYLEQISVHIARDPTKYESSFINKIYEMADRLKYYDPVLEKTIDDQQQGNEDEGGAENALNTSQHQMEEQKWLQSLRQMAQQYKTDYSTAAAPAAAVAAVATAAVSALDGQQQQVVDPSYNYQQQHIDQQFMEINKQFSELNLQYQTQNQEQLLQQPPAFYNQDLVQQTPQQTVPMMSTDQQPMSLDPYQAQNEMSVNDLQQQQIQQPLESTPSNVVPPQDPYQQQQTTYMQPDLQQGYMQNYYDPSQQPQQQQYNNDGNLDNQQTADNASYDYWSQQQQPPSYGSEENARPTISMPKSKTYDSDDDNKQQASQKSAGSDSKQQQQSQQKNGKENKEAKNVAPSNQNSGWFGGIWNKFSLKPKNQMILPDDKNPSIVWDPEKKKWVNTDGDEQPEESFKPPPKMGDMMPHAAGGAGGPPQQAPPPTSQTNMVPQMPTQMMASQPLQNQIPYMDPQQQQQQQQYVPTSIPNSAAPSSNPMSQQQQQTQSNAATAAAPNPNNPAPAKTPTLQSNMFKMQRNRTLKNAYVDVFNPSGAPVNKAAENILAPALPPAAVPQSGFFIPGGSGTTAAGGGGVSQDNSGYQQQQPQDTPQFYNPNQYGAGGTGY